MRQLVRLAAFSLIIFITQNAFGGGMPSSDPDTVVKKKPKAASNSSTSSSSSNSASSAGVSSSTATSNTSSGTTNNTDSSNSNATNDDTSSESGAAFVAIEDDPLIVDASAIMDNDGMGKVQVQWQISNDGSAWMNLTGAVHQSFTPREIHVGQMLRVQITYVDGQGNLESLVSPPSTRVQNVNDKPTGAPQLAGNAREEDALVVDNSTIADEDGVGEYQVIWQRSSTKTDWQAYPNAVGEVLQLTQSHVGYSYRAVVSYRDGHGTREVLVTNPSETVVNVDDPVEGEILLTGEAKEGEVLTANTDRVSDEDGIASLTIGWETSRDGRNWRSMEASGTRFALNQNIVDHQVRARVSVVDFFGVETVIFSQATNAVKNVNNKPAGTIFVRRVGN